MLEFGISELNAGDCNWTVSTASSSTETVLAGRVLFSRQCFAFDLHYVDQIARKAAEQGQKNQSLDEDASVIAKDFAFKRSLEVRFENIVRIDSDGELFTLTVTQPPTCFFRPPGLGKVVSLTEDATGGALSICFHLAPAGEGQVTFAEATELALMHAPRLEELFQNLTFGSEKSPVTPIRIKRAAPQPGSSVKRRRTCTNFRTGNAVWLTA